MATVDKRWAAVADLAILAYFFAMRSCEITTTPNRGRTKIIRLGGVAFRNKEGREMDIRNYDDLLKEATRITVTFEDQKNGLKMDKRTHQRTGDIVMCPVRRMASIARRMINDGMDTGPDTPVNLVRCNGQSVQITGEYLRDSLRTTCREGGGKATFGYDPDEIGTRSIRSGAAMGLFLMNHSVAKIMILGRWSSDAFLVYIRPQVMEWTNQMSSDMIENDSFFDAGNRRTKTSEGTSVPTKRVRMVRGQGGHKRNRGRTETEEDTTPTPMHLDH